ncbi:MAG: hypothetical protein EON95_02195 [Caulobacteraceae bacterium]|nr:hypothetical protein [Caulobacter sp.]RYF95256.1 MAG: hypothetical protein EON95_02195 [Caulobacteraceae bacterium]
MRLSSVLILGASLVAITACASVPPPPPPPPAGERMAAPAKPSDGVNRRQYFDEKRGKYYYFDARRGGYFWENGQPRT